MILYTVQEAAELLRVSTVTVRSYIESGKLRAGRRGGSGHYLIEDADIREFLGLPALDENHRPATPYANETYEEKVERVLRLCGRRAV
jgi:excisionase family DNA binding protein